MVDTATRIGLLPGFGWIADQSFLVTLLLAWLIVSGLHYPIGIVGESRLIPLRPSKQFVSFFPGDLIPGIGLALFMQLAKRLPAEERWYANVWVHLGMIVVLSVVAFLMTRQEYRDGVYPLRAILSPTKLYHNFVLYVLFAYVIIMPVVAVIATQLY